MTPWESSLFPFEVSGWFVLGLSEDGVRPAGWAGLASAFGLPCGAWLAGFLGAAWGACWAWCWAWGWAWGVARPLPGGSCLIGRIYIVHALQILVADCCTEWVRLC